MNAAIEIQEESHMCHNHSQELVYLCSTELLSIESWTQARPPPNVFPFGIDDNSVCPDDRLD